eukprot:TRINITY_DN11837_c0_g1_i1.p1 TRINITY_DN11837_c0_g1~~TRINITY_DN11837_c0_g1_i1.p1  ORF type:complete len:273 (-),score=68.26 TRINITY_DN11837_c0_g1_i1:118-936(-)
MNSITCDDIPIFTSAIRSNQRVVVHGIDELDPVAQLERAEMEAEDISQLALVPVTAQGKDETPVVGFIGVDRCGEEHLPWNNASLECLQIAGRFLFALQSFGEMVDGAPILPCDKNALAHPASEEYRRKSAGELWGVLTQSQLFRLTEQYFALMPQVMPPSSTELSGVQAEAAAHFSAHRYALLPPEVWSSSSLEDGVLEDFRTQILKFVHTMEPDIAPYTRFRNVGYARYAYRNGTILPLLHKPFFQVDPKANILLPVSYTHLTLPTKRIV